MALTRPRLGQINTTVSNFTDPIVVFNAGSTQANVDQGILFNRANGLVSNVALFFSESANSFVFGFTSNSGQTNSNIQITNNANLKIQNLYFDNLFFANGQTYSAVSTYGNSNVAAYIPTDPTVTGIQANLGAYQIWANLTLSTVANAVNQQEAIDSINANIGSYQFYANANASTQSLSIDNINANVGAYQLFANANVVAIQANLGAFQLFANANAASQQTQIDNITTQIYANANVAAYLPTYSGNLGGTLTTVSQPNITTLGGLTSFGSNFGSTIAQGNLTVVGNLTVQGNTITIGSNNLTVTDSIIDLHTPANLQPLISDDGRDIGFRFHYYKGSDDHAFFGWENDTETLIYLQRSDETNSNIAGTYGNVQFGSLLLSNTTAATSTTSGAFQVRGGAGISGALWIQNTGDVSANIGAYQTYANANVVAIQANLGAFQIFSNTNAAAQATSIDNINANLGSYQSFANASIVSLFTNANANTAAYLTTYTGNIQAGNLLITGNIRASSNVFANIFYVTDSIRWAGNGAVFASGGGGGGGITYTASNTAPGSPSIGDQWYYVASDILFEYLNDGDSNQWVDVNGLGQLATSNITLIGDATLQGNITVQNNNLYSIGAASGYLKNIFSNTVTANIVTVSGTLTGNVVGNITGNVYGNIFNSTGNINVAGNLIPDANVTYSLGSSSRRWKDLWVSGNTIYIGSETITVSSNGTWTFSSNGSSVQLSSDSTTFNGNIVANGNLTTAGNITTSGSILPTANTTQDLGTSTTWWGTFYGISTQAQYADLAENYLADAEYQPGTVLVFGGACEVTVSTNSHDTRIAGVVSENPAYLMNAIKGNVSVALTGRVPCQVQGPVDKGTVLVSSSVPGVAQALNTQLYVPGCVIGKSLETIEDDMIKTIEIAVGRF